MMTVSAIWQASLVQLREMLNADTFNRWIAGIVPVRQEGNTLVLGVSCDIFSDWLTLNYKGLIERVVRDACASADLGIAFESGHEAPVMEVPEPAIPAISSWNSHSENGGRR